MMPSLRRQRKSHLASVLRIPFFLATFREVFFCASSSQLSCLCESSSLTEPCPESVKFCLDFTSIHLSRGSFP